MCKKLDPSDKANYRPIVIILSQVSKLFEKRMYDQLHGYIDHFPDIFFVASVRLTPRNMLLLDYYHNGTQS